MKPPAKPEEEKDPQAKNQSRARQDLLSPAEAKSEFQRRLVNVLPDLPALGVVIAMGGIGAALAHWWHLKIGEEQFIAASSNASIWLLISLGSLGASATVFLIAKTDTSKLIHCGLISVLSGMAGPYLVTKALSSVLSVNPNLVQVEAAITAVKATTDALEQATKTSTAETDPQKFVDILDKTAQAAVSYLSIVKSAPKEEKAQALADTKQQLQLQDTLKVLSAAANVAPKQSLQLLTKVAGEAKDAGASDIARDAKAIIASNSAVQNAVQTAKLSGKVYFITPANVTDVAIQRLTERIKSGFPLADIQPVVHPTREMENGLEIVYYRDLPGDKQNADELLKLLSDYFKERKIANNNPRVRQGSTDQPSAPFQFDIHIGPDLASRLLSSGK